MDDQWPSVRAIAKAKMLHGLKILQAKQLRNKSYDTGIFFSTIYQLKNRYLNKGQDTDKFLCPFFAFDWTFSPKVVETHQVVWACRVLYSQIYRCIYQIMNLKIACACESVVCTIKQVNFSLFLHAFQFTRCILHKSPYVTGVYEEKKTNHHNSPIWWIYMLTIKQPVL